MTTDALDLELAESDRAVAAAVARFCEQQDSEALARRAGEPFPWQAWRALAALGVFAAAAPGHDDAGDARTVCAICEALGDGVFPGPIADTFLAVQVVQADQADALIEGRSLVAVSRGASGLLPWGMAADLLLAVTDGGIAPVTTEGELTAVQTLGGEIWARADLRHGQQLPQSERGLLIANIALAAWLAAAALRLVHTASEHAATRKQFGRALGDFQAVAHPLPDCAIAATAARHLARAAARSWTGGEPTRDTRQLAAGAALSARRAALDAVHTCHQVYGAIGVTLEGPAFHITRRIRQLASQVCHGAREQSLLLATTGTGAQ